MQIERLNHLGIVAGVRHGIGLAMYLDALSSPSDEARQILLRMPTLLAALTTFFAGQPLYSASA